MSRKGSHLWDLPSAEFQHDGCILRFSPIPKKADARGKPGIRPLGMLSPGEAQHVDDRRALRAAVEDKAGRYGDLGAPLVIAVNAVNQHLDETDIGEALLGREIVVVKTDDPIEVVGTRRDTDGAWLKPSGASNTRASAVLVVSSLIPWSVAMAGPIVYHHPWAKYPCQGLLRELPAAIPADGRLELVQGSLDRSLFGLPNGWPRSELRQQ